MTIKTPGLRSLPRARRVGVSVLAAASLALAVPSAASAATTTYPSDSAAPDLVSLLYGYNSYWVSSGVNDLHGTVKNAAVLGRDDALTVWINQNATTAQRFKALQDSEYQTTDGTAYDQSITVSTALGSVLGPLYVKGRTSGALPLTSAVINSSNGTAGAYVSTSTAKAAFSHPRPYLPSDATASAVSGDAAECAPSTVNGSSQQAIRVGQSYADAKGNLKITRVAPVTDTTHQFSSSDVTLDAGYGTSGICTGGSFPSGHTTTAYEAGITLATLLPELAPEILARASEAGNNRIVLGVHYPLDIMGGRMDGEAALAARWSDEAYRTEVLEPARKELLSYFKKATGRSLIQVIGSQKAYTSNPYGGKKMPGGSAQVVTDRKSAVSVYRERMTYGFARTGTKHQAASVPAGAENLLLTAFPTLTKAQRVSVLAQTEIASGYPLDTAGTSGSWERLNLAAATSATVKLGRDGKVRVVSTGGTAKVIGRR
ncbi:phosphatase PAP2 family protein [Kineosporia sp. J2-2]|uniref:Phosphatase PAP2 family protein n=1 Tax=Kineosporia corallincola TaxID=2835133 RepID=A0ABS5TBE2_9ACTN|nr:phosphatase PAP2 family protein [Kineosporia corallincola]MBT0768158.1 phosphatase PAP2 family protein [Kineosporia corallincola]